MELFIFIVFQLLMEVQTYKSPAVKVSPEVLTESSSVTIRCETPEGPPVYQCFYITEEKGIKQNWKCELELTGDEVLRWADVKSPASVDIYCFYTIKENGIIKPSPHSPAATVTVRVSTTASTEHTSTTASTAHTTTTVSTEHTSTTASTAHMTTTASTEHTSTTAMTTSLTVRSTSDTAKYSKAVDLKTNLPTNTTNKTMYTWLIVLVSTCVGVFLTGFVCLCWFASKKRRKHKKIRLINSDEPSQGIGMVQSCSGPAETYSLITSVPARSQPISVDLEHPESHQNSTPDPTAAYSSITTANSIYSEVSVNTQQKEDNTEENEIVYHLYCTIPDKPVPSNAGDQVYSLVKMH
ncbi:mucin-5AC isoform X1 [Pimephales promelas]|uniref:mucin-5AC isoform X1 n=1 Tax=Pimephales promelas TaxID=90988 RepID=UPI001955A9D4|nr:mucin-5AC isoform X1 [Pimephales promelas]